MARLYTKTFLLFTFCISARCFCHPSLSFCLRVHKTNGQRMGEGKSIINRERSNNGRRNGTLRSTSRKPPHSLYFEPFFLAILRSCSMPLTLAQMNKVELLPLR